MDNNALNSTKNLIDYLKKHDNFEKRMSKIKRMGEKRIAENYLTFLENKELASYTDSLVVDRKSDVWEVFICIVEKTDNFGVLSAAGVHILEQMLIQYPKEIIDKVEQYARKSVKFQYVLYCIWNTFIEDKYWNRIADLMTSFGFDYNTETFRKKRK